MLHTALIALSTALIGCTSAPEKPPRDPAASEKLYQQAEQALKTRRLDAAAQTLEQLLTGDTLHYKAALTLGEIYLRQKRYSQALVPLERAQRLKPERLEARLQLARTLDRH